MQASPPLRQANLPWIVLDNTVVEEKLQQAVLLSLLPFHIQSGLILSWKLFVSYIGFICVHERTIILCPDASEKLQESILMKLNKAFSGEDS